MTMLIEDYIHEMSQFPAETIAKACRQWRLVPENRFFPSLAELLAKCRLYNGPFHSRMRAIESVLKHKPQPERRPEPELALPPITKEEKIRRTIEAMKASGSPQADIDEFKKMMGISDFVDEQEPV